MPPEPAKWQESLDEQLEKYEAYKNEYPCTNDDEDQKLWEEIDKDVRRTRREMKFFEKEANNESVG